MTRPRPPAVRELVLVRQPGTLSPAASRFVELSVPQTSRDPLSQPASVERRPSTGAPQQDVTCSRRRATDYRCSDPKYDEPILITRSQLLARERAPSFMSHLLGVTDARRGFVPKYLDRCHRDSGLAWSLYRIPVASMKSRGHR